MVVEKNTIKFNFCSLQKNLKNYKLWLDTFVLESKSVFIVCACGCICLRADGCGGVHM